MMNSLALVPNMLKFIFSFRSIVFLTFLAISFTLVALFGVTKVSGFGTGSVVSIFGNEIHFALISLLFGNVYLVLTLFVLLITIQVSEFIFFGHFAQSIICKYRNRLPVLAAYLVASISIAIFAALLYTSYYIPISPGPTHFFYTFIYSALYFYTIVLATTLVVNFSVLKKYTILFIIFLFYIIPVTLKLVLQLFSGHGVMNSISTSILTGFTKLTSVHIEVSNQVDNIIRTGLLQSGLILETVGLLSIYVLIIGYQYMRKDFS